MNKKNIILTISISMVFMFIFYGIYENFGNINQTEVKESTIKKHIKTTNSISMMYETSAGSGIYEMSNDTSWPSEGYVFNEHLSKCENGSPIEWDNNTKSIKLTTNMSEKCYIYFDAFDNRIFANYIKSLYTAQGSNGIYYHDSTLENGAEDNSYRYSGANPNNYVCFGSTASTCPSDNLFRIIGVFDDQVKLIQADHANYNQLGKDGEYHGVEKIAYYKWNSSTADGGTELNNWNESRLNTINLNKNFINFLGEQWTSKIATTSWVLAISSSSKRDYPKTIYDNELGSLKNNATYDTKIGLMYASEYLYAASPTYWLYSVNDPMGGFDYSDAKSENWMYLQFGDWTITGSSNFSNQALTIEYDVDGYRMGGISSAAVTSGQGVRATFYLIPTVRLASGTGTQSDPYRIEL